MRATIIGYRISDSQRAPAKELKALVTITKVGYGNYKISFRDPTNKEPLLVLDPVDKHIKFEEEK